MVPEGLTALDTQIAGLLLTEEPTHIDALLARSAGRPTSLSPEHLALLCR